MEHLPEKDAKLLVRLCDMYYNQEKSQQEISEIVGVSRPQISRLLKTAKEAGIVSFTIRDPYSEESHYEQALSRTYGLVNALVVNTHGEGINQQLADEATMMLNSLVKDDNILGVMAGTTINSLSNMLGPVNHTGVKIVPLVGGVGPEGTKWQANINVNNFGEKFSNCYCYQLNAPAFLSSDEVADALLKEPAISKVLEIARKSSVAIVGIGTITEDNVTFSAEPLDFREITELRKHDAVASICASFLNNDGLCVTYPGEPRHIGLTVEEMKIIPKVIAIAVGAGKVNAIKAVLRGRWVDTLITNLDTAKLILDSQK